MSIRSIILPFVAVLVSAFGQDGALGQGIGFGFGIGGGSGGGARFGISGQYDSSPTVQSWDDSYHAGYSETYVREPTLVPTTEQLSRMGRSELRAWLRQGIDYLDKSVKGLAAGSGWEGFLQFEAIHAEANGKDDAVMAPEELETFLVALGRFELVAAHHEYRKIAELGGFRFVTEVLRAYAIPEAQRRRAGLIAASAELNRRLEEFPHGDSWKAYLSLPPGFAAKHEIPAVTAESNAVGALLARFDAVAENPTFNSVSSLPAFKAMHKSLSSFAALTPLKPPPPDPTIAAADPATPE